MTDGLTLKVHHRRKIFHILSPSVEKNNESFTSFIEEFQVMLVVKRDESIFLILALGIFMIDFFFF